MTTWQPIDTAPRDGTLILAFTPDSCSGTVMVMSWEGSEWMDNGSEPWDHQPTFWAPIPDFTAMSEAVAAFNLKEQDIAAKKQELDWAKSRLAKIRDAELYEPYAPIVVNGCPIKQPKP